MNKAIDITENEYRLLQAVESGEALSQRKLAGHLDISLGMVNLCLRRLIKQGYIKTHGLNKKKVKYLLTPKGFAEKMKKTYQYTQKTISELARMKANIRLEIEKRYNAGEREFVIAGSGELSDLTEIAIRNLKYKGVKYKRTDGNGEDALIVGEKKLPLMVIAAKL